MTQPTPVSPDILAYLVIHAQEALPNRQLDPDEYLAVASSVVAGYLALVANRDAGPAIGTVLQRSDGSIAKRIVGDGISKWRIISDDGIVSYDMQPTPEGDDWDVLTSPATAAPVLESAPADTLEKRRSNAADRS